ncbi:MAG: ABC transporter permease [Acidimicrobiia bacterium]|nr:ABC transporter permease [Acidimicrobiia bacterium]
MSTETDSDTEESVEAGMRTAGFDAPREGVGEYLAHRWQAIQAGDLGSLPIIVGLIVIVLIFGVLEDQFLTARNFTNLLLQMAPISFFAIGIVFILLIADGEIVTIDLSVAFVGAVGGAVLVLLQRPGDPGWPWWACILGALALTTAIGFVHSIIITKLGVPSFITTLAAFLIWSGVLLWLTTEFTEAGTIRISDSTLIDLANNFLPEWLGWTLGIVVVVGYALSQLYSMQSRRRRGLEAKPLVVVVAQVAAVTVLTLGAVAIANSDRGVPQVTLTLGVFLAFWTFVASRTAFGRHIYAVGGSPEAARRAGINVDGIRIAVFMINGFMAGVGGIILVSRLRSVATNTGGGNLLLNIIAAAVIGGTSLFGGQGRVISALYGALVITAIQNGMDLLGLSSGFKFIITGIVLLLAVLVDSVSKRRRTARGLA